MRDAIRVLDAASWEHLSTALWDWIHPDYSGRGVEVGEDVGEVMRAFAARVLQDLVPLAKNSPGLIAGLRDLAANLDLDLALEQDPVFETLFPAGAESVDDLERQAAKQEEATRNLATLWSEKSPEEITRRILGYEEEASKIKQIWPRWTPILCRELSTLVSNPEAWLEELLQIEAPPDLVEPFLRVTLSRHQDASAQILERCLKSKPYVWLATEALLKSSDPPSRLLNVALEGAAGFPSLIETLCLRKQVPLPVLKSLLEHSAWEVGLAAAVGEWLSDPKASVRVELAEPWRAAVLRAHARNSSGFGYWLGQILAQQPDLAYGWLLSYVSDQELRSDFFLSPQEPVPKAVSALGKAQRVALLERPEGRFSSPLISLLVDKDVEVYEALLGLKALSRFHLEPLAYTPDENWAELAMTALKEGYELRSIAKAAFDPTGVVTSWTSESRHWKKWDDAFAQLENDSRLEIREIAGLGRVEAQSRIQRAKERERREEIHGF